MCLNKKKYVDIIPLTLSSFKFVIFCKLTGNHFNLLSSKTKAFKFSKRHISSGIFTSKFPLKSKCCRLEKQRQASAGNSSMKFSHRYTFFKKRRSDLFSIGNLRILFPFRYRSVTGFGSINDLSGNSLKSR